jgi:hypothetical protein
MAVYYYFLDDELMRVQQKAYTAFWTENNLGQRAFRAWLPGTRSSRWRSTS